MKNFYIQINEDDGLCIIADELSEKDERLVVFKNNEKIAEIKTWYYWREVLE